MARAAVKAKQQARAKAHPAKPARGRRRHAGGGNPNQDLFFSRLRRRQKWVFLALAIIFAATFAGVGVGSGSGADLGSIFTGLFGGNKTSVQSAQAEIKTNPVKGYMDLAAAYLQENPADNADAIGAYQSYLKLRKKDASTWLRLAALQEQQGNNYVTLYQQAAQQGALADPAQAIQPPGALATQLGTNPVETYYQQQSSSQTSQYLQLATTNLSGAVQSFQKVVDLQPHSQDGIQAEFQIGTLQQQLNQKLAALTAFQRYVALDPHSQYLVSVEKACQALGGVCTPAYVKALNSGKHSSKKPKH
jgi:hypothetical protein